jgi:hypothetical protein
MASAYKRECDSQADRSKGFEQDKSAAHGALSQSRVRGEDEGGQQEPFA